MAQRAKSAQALALGSRIGPDGRAVHVVCDNYATHKSPTITRWARAYPQFTTYFTPRPTAPGWVERLFSEVTRNLLQRSDHRSVQALETDLRNWISAWNNHPKLFIWAYTAEHILNITQQTSSTNYRRRTLATSDEWRIFKP